MMKENHILMHADVLDAVLADYSGRFVSRRDYNDGKTYGYVTNLKIRTWLSSIRTTKISSASVMRCPTTSVLTLTTR